jgi:hypothetical protein
MVVALIACRNFTHRRLIKATLLIMPGVPTKGQHSMIRTITSQAAFAEWLRTGSPLSVVAKKPHSCAVSPCPGTLRDVSYSCLGDEPTVGAAVVGAVVFANAVSTVSSPSPTYFRRTRYSSAPAILFNCCRIDKRLHCHFAKIDTESQANNRCESPNEQLDDLYGTGTTY